MADQSMSVISYPASTGDPVSSERQKSHTFFCWSVIPVCIAIAGTLAIGFIVWELSLMAAPEVRIDTITVSNFNFSVNKLVSGDWLISGDWDAKFVVRNPSSKLTLSYDQIKAQILYQSDLISKNTTVSGFVLGAKNETAIRATSIASVAVISDYHRDSIIAERNNGEIKVDAIVFVRVKHIAWVSRRKTFQFHCCDLAVATGNGGTLVGGSKKCKLVIDNSNYISV